MYPSRLRGARSSELVPRRRSSRTARRNSASGSGLLACRPSCLHADTHHDQVDERLLL